MVWNSEGWWEGGGVYRNKQMRVCVLFSVVNRGKGHRVFPQSAFILPSVISHSISKENWTKTHMCVCKCVRACGGEGDGLFKTSWISHKRRKKAHLVFISDTSRVMWGQTGRTGRHTKAELTGSGGTGVPEECQLMTWTPFPQRWCHRRHSGVTLGHAGPAKGLHAGAFPPRPHHHLLC